MSNDRANGNRSDDDDDDDDHRSGIPNAGNESNASVFSSLVCTSGLFLFCFAGQFRLLPSTNARKNYRQNDDDDDDD